MTDTTTVATGTTTGAGTRCQHDAERASCPFCGLERATLATGAGTGNIASTARLAGAMRAALRDAARARATARGYRMLSGTVSAQRAESPILRAVSDTAERVGELFYTDIAGDTVERFAGYIGRDGMDLERLRGLLESPAYASRVARRVARSLASRAGTGRGSMPRIARDDDDAERAIVRAYRDAAAESPAFTIGHGHGHGLPARRAMTDAERALVLQTFRPERVERSPLYARWLDGMGDGIPNARDGHGTGHVAPYLPERDAQPLRRGSVFARLAAVGCDADTLRAIVAVWDIVNVPDASGRYRRVAPWREVASTTTQPITGANVARRARTYATALRARERDAMRDDGQPFTVSVESLPATITVASTTGRRRSNVYGQPIQARTTGAMATSTRYVWRATGAEHRADCRTSCATGCDAIALMPIRATVIPSDAPAVPVPVCNDGGHAGDGCPPSCDVRVARRARIERWDSVTTTTPALARKVASTNGAERARAIG